MMRGISLTIVAALSSVTLLSGCMPKMTIEEMKAMMPGKPAELAKLNAFIGRWTFEGEATMAGLDEVLKASGSNEAKWEGDGWILSSDGHFNLGGLGEMQGFEKWVYDTHSKKFRTTWVDSMGAIGTGVVRHNEKTNTWHIRAKSYGPFGKTIGKGQVRFVDADTMEWTWKEYALGGLMKVMEMTGTSRRQ